MMRGILRRVLLLDFLQTLNLGIIQLPLLLLYFNDNLFDLLVSEIIVFISLDFPDFV